MSSDAASDVDEVKVSAWYAVGVRQAFSAWANPGKIEKWFGPEGFRAEVLEMDFKIGGRWRFKMISQSGDVSHHHGRYLAIEPGNLLSFTWESEEDGDLTEGRETRVSVRFRAEAGGSRVTLVHKRLPTLKAKQVLQSGWSSGMPKLRRLLEGTRDD
ncbi:SRPBCC domain-containing protein [Ruegeria sp. 2205SS24-7]|uniref:SRPBCC family protein n=1 Tax=Ruegeria discodermiae TaxID=3064389 RepID=UPI0027417378|nr:SRPBCC domain-containing protein [Ruegeria sp. 2205SS24-7]MDP5218717.1 SRPBCC domain-containing protein [Ruegeria sp. 2205SS24-7]